MQTPERLIYRIDAANCLCACDEAWDRFAFANGAGHLASIHVLGSSLLDHISDSTLRELTGRLIDRVRRRNVTMELPYRCDAPDRIRAMHMRVAPAPGGMVIFESTLVRELPRGAVALLDMHTERGDGFVRICSWCNRGAVGADWVEIDELVRRLSLFECERVPRISHALCAACADSLARGVSL